MNNEKFLYIFFKIHKNEFTYSIQMLAKDKNCNVREALEITHKLNLKK